MDAIETTYISMLGDSDEAKKPWTTKMVTVQLKKWEELKSSNAMFKTMMNYLHPVETILFFVEASRNADLSLHLQR